MQTSSSSNTTALSAAAISSARGVQTIRLGRGYAAKCPPKAVVNVNSRSTIVSGNHQQLAPGDFLKVNRDQPGECAAVDAVNVNSGASVRGCSGAGRVVKGRPQDDSQGVPSGLVNAPLATVDRVGEGSAASTAGHFKERRCSVVHDQDPGPSWSKPDEEYLVSMNGNRNCLGDEMRPYQVSKNAKIRFHNQRKPAPRKRCRQDRGGSGTAGNRQLVITPTGQSLQVAGKTIRKKAIPLICPKCGNEFSYRSNYTRHLKAMHNLVTPQQLVAAEQQRIVQECESPPVEQDMEIIAKQTNNSSTDASNYNYCQSNDNDAMCSTSGSAQQPASYDRNHQLCTLDRLLINSDAANDIQTKNYPPTAGGGCPPDRMADSPSELIYGYPSSTPPLPSTPNSSMYPSVECSAKLADKCWKQQDIAAGQLDTGSRTPIYSRQRLRPDVYSDVEYVRLAKSIQLAAKMEPCGICTHCMLNSPCGKCAICVDTLGPSSSGHRRFPPEFVCKKLRCLAELQRILRRRNLASQLRYGCGTCLQCEKPDCGLCACCADAELFGGLYLGNSLCFGKFCSEKISMDEQCLLGGAETAPSVSESIFSDID